MAVANPAPDCQATSMHPKRREATIDCLASDIERVSTGFERFGGIFIESLLDIPMNHQGINLRGYAVSGVVDSVSEDGTVVAEYSDASDYFGGDMIKARSDLKKALRRRKFATSFYLLSGQRKREKIAAAFESRVLAWKGMRGKELHLWGAEQIAAKIIDELMFNDVVVRKLAEYVPELGRIRGEEAIGDLAPEPAPDRLQRMDVDAEIQRRLDDQRGLVLCGMSGLGKSDAARAYGDRRKGNYDALIWFERDEVPRVEKLHAMPFERGGDTRNVAHLLETGKYLLILDDALPNIALSDLRKLCGERSHVIMTRQRIEPGAYELPMLSLDEAEQILTKTGETCPPNVVAKIWESAGGHPLALNLVAASFRDRSSWQDILDECEAIGNIEDPERGLLLSQRLVGHLERLLAKEFALFHWLGQPTCDQGFLVSQVTIAGLGKLRSNAMTAADRHGVVRLHDVVFSAIKNNDWCSAEQSDLLDEALDKFLTETAEGDELRFWQAARILRPKLERLVEGSNRSAAFRYALLATWQAAETRPELIEDPVESARSAQQKPRHPLEVISIIEAVEQLYLHEGLTSLDKAEERLGERFEAFTRLEELPGLTEREQVQVRHHKAKALKRLKRYGEAAPLFEEVANGTMLKNEAKLQLIDVYKSLRKDGAEGLVVDILSQTPGTKDMTYSVYLGAIERIGRAGGLWRGRVTVAHWESIQDVLTSTSESGLHQAYAAFAAFARYLSKEMPDRFRAIFEAMPEPTLTSLENDAERFAWGEIYGEAGRLGGPSGPAFLAKAKACYEAEVAPEDFHRQRYAELLIDMNLAADAERLLRQRADLDKSEWLQRLMARARLAQNDPAEALTWIDSALRLLKVESFRSEFRELRYRIRLALGHETAVEDLRAAYEASEKDGEKASLKERLAAAEALSANRLS